MTDLIKLRELAQACCDAWNEKKDQLNMASGVAINAFDRNWHIATREFFKFIDWHGDYGSETQGPVKIIALIDALEAAEKRIDELENRIAIDEGVFS